MSVSRDSTSTISRHGKTEFNKRLAEGVGSTELWKLRRITAMTVARFSHVVGDALLLAVDPKSVNHEQIAAFSMLLRMLGELTRASTDLLSSGQHYAGAALLRQVVEIEYLTWTFKEKYRDPAKWLRSTHEERMKEFTPAQLRKTSHGRFLSEDYRHHCEQGGHPVPPGEHLLDGKNVGGAQLLLADLLTHCWRTWDHVLKWAQDLPPVQPMINVASVRIYASLKKWGDGDPLYHAMVEQSPNPDATP
jgi:hypothetical protein